MSNPLAVKDRKKIETRNGGLTVTGENQPTKEKTNVATDKPRSSAHKD